MSLPETEALEIQQRAMRDFVRMLGSSAPASSVSDADGVTAALVPSCPQRSIANSVAFSDAAALRDRLDLLAELYERAGIEAWTVWVPDFDRATIAALEAAGHHFDGKPLAMVLELEAWQPRELGDLDWDADGDGQIAGPLNDLAYGLGDDGLASALVAPPEQVRSYQARAGGEIAAVLATIEHEAGDLGVYFVATDPAQRGKGLASRLLAAALGEARERGLRTSSLQSSAMGEPVYRALGYEPYFRFNMFERQIRSRSPQGEAEARRS